MSLSLPHRKYPRSDLWQVLSGGVHLEREDAPVRTSGPPQTARRIWATFRTQITDASQEFQVPIPLLIATAATETRGHPEAARHEPGSFSRPSYSVHLVDDVPPNATVAWLNGNYRSFRVDAFRAADDETPDRVSVGLMQTLISTARQTLGEPGIGRAELLDPAVSVRAGASYIREQVNRPTEKSTFLDPVLVAPAYNAGGLYQEATTANRWRLRCYPLRTGEHISRFIAWYGDAVAVLGA